MPPSPPPPTGTTPLIITKSTSVAPQSDSEYPPMLICVTVGNIQSMAALMSIPRGLVQGDNQQTKCEDSQMWVLPPASCSAPSPPAAPPPAVQSCTTTAPSLTCILSPLTSSASAAQHRSSRVRRPIVHHHHMCTHTPRDPQQFSASVTCGHDRPENVSEVDICCICSKLSTAFISWLHATVPAHTSGRMTPDNRVHHSPTATTNPKMRAKLTFAAQG
jgi:hypothetical protein